MLGAGAGHVEIRLLQLIFLYHAGGLRERALARLMRRLSFRVFELAAVGHLVGRIEADLRVLSGRRPGRETTTANLRKLRVLASTQGLLRFGGAGG